MYRKIIIILLLFIFCTLNSFAADNEMNTLLKNYLQDVFSKIRENSPMIATKQPILFEVKILPNGNLLDSKIITSSGNEEFDTEVMKAVKKSAPFNKIPSEIKAAYIGAKYSFGYEEKYVTFAKEKENQDYTLKQDDSGRIQLSSANGESSKIIRYKSLQDDEKRNLVITLNNSNNDYELDKYLDRVYDKLYRSIKNTKKMVGQAKFSASLKILKDGTLDGCKIINSTGNSKLDNTMLEIIKDASPFEVFPSSIPLDYVEYTFHANTRLIIK